VKAFSAVRDHDVHFHQLDKRSGARVHNRHVSERSGREVGADDIEMGFEVRRGRDVTFDKDELNGLRPASTRAIEVTDFVALDEIDPICYERTYWLAPDGDPAKKAYALLLAAMEDRGRVGIGGVVIRDKQCLTAVRPLDGALAMSTMRFADEVVPRKDIEALSSQGSRPEPKALTMAAQLIDGLAAPWKPQRYHDTYTETLRKRLENKDNGGTKAVEEETGGPEENAEVVDLMAAPQASVDASKRRRKTRKSA
jgi:DNA end-binding protein Ku